MEKNNSNYQRGSRGTKALVSSSRRSLAESLDERAVRLAKYMIDHRATVRQTASVFGVSKSTVHKDLTEKLPFINHALASQVREVLDINKSERHIRGGMATKDKYLKKKEGKNHFPVEEA